jgi:hypothetical protein
LRREFTRLHNCHVDVMQAVAGDFVSPVCNRAHQVGVVPGNFAQDEERDADAVPVEQLQQRPRGRDHFSGGTV